jgi:hypothetical protein
MLAAMQRHEATGTITGIALILALAAGCAGGQKEGPATADDADSAEAGGDADEDEMMADIDSYLEEEGENVDGDFDAADSGGEDAAEGDESGARDTPKERSDQIYALIKAKRPSVADCYKAAKKKDPKIGTRIAVTIQLGADGKLKSDPVVEEGRTDISNQEVRTCAVDVVKSIEYPAHPQGMETTFTYPFGF